MSGHSKWANIKNRKGAQDKKRSEVFTKASRNIMTALRTGSGLQEAISRAKEVNMPKENIERLISRFESRKDNLIHCQFEGFGPYGVPIIVECETDNKNRILSEVRLIFRNYESSLGEEGSLQFLFDKRGEIEVENLTEEVQLKAIDWGATDFDEKTILTEPSELKSVVQKVKEAGVEVVEERLAMRAKQPVELANEEQLERIMEMVEELEDNDDVINVFAGFDYHE